MSVSITACVETGSNSIRDVAAHGDSGFIVTFDELTTVHEVENMVNGSVALERERDAYIRFR